MTTAFAPYAEYEAEAPAHAYEYEGEWESEHEDEDESEEFFGALASLASRALSNPTLRRVGLGAARAALQAGGRALSDQTGGASNQISGYLQGLLPQSEMEAELEDFADPYRRVYPNRSLMEHIGHAAAEAEDEDEAEALASSLVPLAARRAPALARATPQLTNAMAHVARQLRASPSTRPLVRALPSIVQRTAHTVNRQAAAGHRITPQRAVRALAHHTARTLANPRQLVHDYRRSQQLDHRHHAQRALHGAAGAPAGLRRGTPAHALGWHPRYGYRRSGPYGYWRGYRAPAPGVQAVPGAVPHTHGPHAVPHTHAAPAAPAAYGGVPWRRYGPPPGAPAPLPPSGPPSAGTGTWTCTCQWA
jgi:hypothetical protein